MHMHLDMHKHVYVHSLTAVHVACRWDTLSPYLPDWASQLKSRLLVAKPPPEVSAGQLLEVGPLRSMSGPTSNAGLGLGWLDQALDFGSWAVRDQPLHALLAEIALHSRACAGASHALSVSCIVL